MRQNKTTFVVDNFLDLENRDELKKAVKWLSLLSILYVVEPWPGHAWRIYVRKEAADILIDIEGALRGNNEK